MNEEIIKYAKSNGWDLRHDVDALAFAAEKTANLFSDIEPMKVIRFIWVMNQLVVLHIVMGFTLEMVEL